MKNYVLLDGKNIATKIKFEIKNEVAKLKEKNIEPCLAVINVGDDEASKVYLKSKEKACNEVNIKNLNIELPKSTTQDELLKLVEKLNNDKSVNGILVQVPLPKHLNNFEISKRIDPSKDVDGFQPYNAGLLYLGMNSLYPSTPTAIIEILKRYNITIVGKHCVIVGASNIVGKPLAGLLINGEATVTIANDKTKNLKEITKQADILIIAIGSANFLKSDFIKDGTVIIDVGINNLNGKLCGDVDFNNVLEKVSYITPVPGGVGPVTTAMLLKNCLNACLDQNNFDNN